MVAFYFKVYFVRNGLAVTALLKFIGADNESLGISVPVTGDKV